MRDLEFLPSWYPQLARGRRALVLQTWLTLALVAGLAAWVFLADRNTQRAQATLRAVSGQADQADIEVRQMDRLEALRRQLRGQADTLGRLGLYVERGRLISSLADALPPGVALLSLSLDIEDRPSQLSGIQRAGLKDPAAAATDRQLRAVIRGVAPSDIELATLLTELSKMGFIENLTPVYSKDRRENARVLREFEIAFSISLNPSPEEAI